jgi:hypothetical protein
MFYDRRDAFQFSCAGCPVSAATGCSGCAGSPYTKFLFPFDLLEEVFPEDRERFLEQAQAELDFLRSLAAQLQEQRAGNGMPDKALWPYAAQVAAELHFVRFRNPEVLEMSNAVSSRPRGAPLERGHFKAWLEQFPSDKIVGWAFSACDCPIAVYAGKPFNGSDTPGFPKWAVAFAAALDAQHWDAEHDRVTNTAVRASEALLILEGVPSCSQPA